MGKSSSIIIAIATMASIGEIQMMMIRLKSFDKDVSEK
jgi:hypothetical protein